MDSTPPRVVPVDERVGKRLTERGLGIGGDRHAKQPRLQLFLRVPGLEPGEHLLGEPQQGVGKEVADLNLKSPEHLERRLVSWQEAPQRIGSAKQQQRLEATGLVSAVGSWIQGRSSSLTCSLMRSAMSSDQARAQVLRSDTSSSVRP